MEGEKQIKKTALYCTNQCQFNFKSSTPNNAVFAYLGKTHTRVHPHTHTHAAS